MERTLNFKISEELYEKLRKEAYQTRVPMAEIIRRKLKGNKNEPND